MYIKKNGKGYFASIQKCFFDIGDNNEDKSTLLLQK